jgi:hypothetical protein
MKSTCISFLMLSALLSAFSVTGQYVGHPASDIAGGNPLFNTILITDRIGIGTSAPIASLDVRGTIRATDICIDDGSGCKNLSSGIASALSAPDGSPADAIIVDNNGRVGIGTSSPTQALQVRGGMRVTGLPGCGSVGTDIDGTFKCLAAGSVNAGLGLVASNGLSVGAGQGISTSEDQVYITHPIYSCVDGFALAGINLINGQATCSNLSQMSLWKIGQNIYTMSSVSIGSSQASSGLTLDVEGRIGASEYCDQNGLNCYPASQKTAATLDLLTVMCQDQQSAKLSAACTATCPVGYKVTGGGCVAKSDYDYVRATMPVGDNAWYCQVDQNTGGIITTDSTTVAVGTAVCMRG